MKDPQGFTNKDHSILEMRYLLNFSYSSTLCYNHSIAQMCFIIDLKWFHRWSMWPMGLFDFFIYHQYILLLFCYYLSLEKGIIIWFIIWIKMCLVGLYLAKILKFYQCFSLFHYNLTTKNGVALWFKIAWLFPRLIAEF